MIEAAAGIPFGALVAVRGDAAGVFDHAREVHQIPSHKSRVAIGEIVFGAARSFVQIRRAGAGFAQPSGVGLRRNRVAQMLQRIQNVHRAVLGAVFVAGDEAAADAAIIGVLPAFVEVARRRIKPFDGLRANRRFFAEPDRGRDDENVRRFDFFVDLRPVVFLPAVLGHIGLNAESEIAIDGANNVDRDAVFAHNLGGDIDEPLRVRFFGRALERAVKKQRAQVVKFVGMVGAIFQLPGREIHCLFCFLVMPLSRRDDYKRPRVDSDCEDRLRRFLPPTPSVGDDRFQFAMTRRRLRNLRPRPRRGLTRNRSKA